MVQPTKLDDVAVAYYSDTSKDHPIGVILFRNGSDQRIQADRVELDITYPTIYFRTDHEGKGLRLNNQKIQLWSLANIAKHWEGIYPLDYDPLLKCYCIHRAKKKLYIKDDTNPKLGQPVNYTPHYGERASASVVPAGYEIEKETKMDKITGIKPVSTDENSGVSKYDGWRQSTINFLNKKVVDYITCDRVSDAKAIAEAVKVLMKDKDA